jgi:hypothetical protein
MRFSGKPTGPLGLALLAVTALTGVVLAVHGWSGRHSGLPAGALAGSGPAQAMSPRPARPGRAAGPSAPAADSSAPAATPSGPGASPSGPGPLLNAQSYAQYSFRVWPGTPSAAAQAALTGLTVKVARRGSGIMVTAGVIGQPANPAQFYAHGAVVYVVEASLGDDSGNSDYSLGDDGLVVTDAQGRIVQ